MRSYRSNSVVQKDQNEANQLNIWNLPRDMIFRMQTGMVPTTVIDYVILISEDVRGHRRSKEVKTGHNWKMQPGMQFFAFIPLWYTQVV